MKYEDEDEEFVNDDSETFILKGKEYFHSERWKALMKRLDKLGPHEQEIMRAEIRKEAHRELERRTAKQN